MDLFSFDQLERMANATRAPNGFLSGRNDVVADEKIAEKISDGSNASVAKPVISQLPIVNRAGSAAGTVEIKESWVERQRGTQAVHDVVVAYRAGLRRGTASTKTRAEVSGGGRKPWRQKGTGRARVGSNRSPLWRGGGVIFGPVPRDYSKRVNKQVRKLALKRSWVSRVDENDVIVIDSLALASPKTKELLAILAAIGGGEHALIVMDDSDNPNVALAARNLATVKIVPASKVNVYDLLLYKKIIFTKSGLDQFGSRLESENGRITDNQSNA